MTGQQAVADRLNYMASMLSTRWYRMAAVGLTMLIVAPLYFWLEYKTGSFTVPWLLLFLAYTSTHILQLVYSAIFLIALFFRRRFDYPAMEPQVNVALL